MNKLIGFALSQRLFFTLLAIVILGFGVKSYRELPIDAFPDISPTQVKIIIKSNGMTPAEIESRITVPIETKMVGIPFETVMRSTSKYGLCDITIDFEDGTDIYWARQQVSERLSDIKAELPANLEGGLAPISTPLSDILMFSIESDALSLIEKRSLLDWVIAPKIRSVSGVAEVNALGGEVKTYEVIPDLGKIRTMGISLDQIFKTLEENNQNDGTGRVSQGVESILVRSVGRLQTLGDIEKLPVTKRGNKVVTIGEIATVGIGHLSRAGFVSKNGEGEAVQGLVLGLKGSNTAQVLKKVKEELKNLEPMLPNDTKIEIFYDRSDLVNLATDTVKNALYEAVFSDYDYFAVDARESGICSECCADPPVCAPDEFHRDAVFWTDRKSDEFGRACDCYRILVDSAVVMVEHITAELGNPKHERQHKLHIIYEAAIEMAPSIITGVLIIIIVFMPLLTLQGLEGKLFGPVALSIVFALFSSLILALTLIPVLSSFILKKATR